MPKVASKQPSAERLIETYIRIRDEVDTRRKALEAELTEMKEEMSVIESALREQLNTAGAESIKAKAGTAFFNKKDYVSLESYDSFLEFVRSNDAWQFLPRSVVKSAVKEYMDENNGALPPGVSYGVERVVQIRRARS